MPIDHPLRSPLAVSQGTSVEDAASFLNEQHGLPTVGALRALRHASGDPHEAPLNALGRRLLRSLRLRRSADAQAELGRLCAAMGDGERGAELLVQAQGSLPDLPLPEPQPRGA